MNPSPAFLEALKEEREDVLDLLRLRPSPELFRDALGRLADLDELEARVVERPADSS